MDRVLDWITRQDLGNPLVIGEPLAGRSSGQIGGREQIVEAVVAERELSHQLSLKAALSRLKACAGMMSHELNNPIRPTFLTQVPRAVERMKTRVTDLRRVPDVMEPGRGHDGLTIPMRARQRIHPLHNSLHMQPPPTERAHQFLGNCRCLVHYLSPDRPRGCPDR